ncbi:ORF6N domain-containing protein [Candidatus Margulisiibacteriota bacterium]
MHLVPLEVIENKILLIRGEKVMLDRHLAKLYGVPIKRLNEQVKRNTERFPEDFMFQLTKAEADRLRSQNATLKRGEHRKYLPYVFTELGVAMLSSVLNSKTAIQINMQIMRTFTKLRRILANNKELSRKFEAILKVHGHKLKEHDHHIAAIFNLINKLLDPDTKPKARIGFK